MSDEHTDITVEVDAVEDVPETADSLRAQAYANGLRLPSRASLQELATKHNATPLEVTRLAIEAARTLPLGSEPEEVMRLLTKSTAETEAPAPEEA